MIRHQGRMYNNLLQLARVRDHTKLNRTGGPTVPLMFEPLC